MLLKVAICDDNPYELDEICSKVKNRFNRESMDYEIVRFASLNELENSLLQENYGLFLLDIQFDTEKKTSLNLAQKISEISPSAPIIFITAYSNFFPEVYICNHIYCLLKEELDKHLPRALDKAMQAIRSEGGGETLSLTFNRQVHVVPLDEVLYLEKNLRKIRFHCRHPENYVERSERAKRLREQKPLTIDVYGVFDEYLPLLSAAFVQIHRSYIVNLNYIKSLQREGLVMLNGDLIPISRQFRSQFMKAMKQYFFHEGEDFFKE